MHVHPVFSSSKGRSYATIKHFICLINIKYEPFAGIFARPKQTNKQTNLIFFFSYFTFIIAKTE